MDTRYKFRLKECAVSISKPSQCLKRSLILRVILISLLLLITSKNYANTENWAHPYHASMEIEKPNSHSKKTKFSKSSLILGALSLALTGAFQDVHAENFSKLTNRNSNQGHNQHLGFTAKNVRQTLRGSIKSNSESNLEDVIANSFVLGQFEASLVATQTIEEIRYDQRTIFIPWDQAFLDLPYWRKITKRPWFSHLRDLIYTHIHEGEIALNEPSEPPQADMLSGDIANLSYRQGTLTKVDGIRVISSTATKQGFAYMLDGVREPKWASRTALQIINEDPRFKILSLLLAEPEFAQVKDGLADEASSLTFFAPTDSALERLLPEVCQTQQSCYSYLLNSNLQHFMMNNVFPKSYTPSTALETSNGRELEWDSDSNTLSCRSSETNLEEYTDLSHHSEELGINGVIYPIESLLCLESLETSSPTPTPTDPGNEQSCSSTNICQNGLEFLPDEQLRGVACQSIMENLTVDDAECQNPGIDIVFACCQTTMPPTPPRAGSPCLNFCPEGTQMIGSRLIQNGDLTCWDYSMSLESTDPMCTEPETDITSTCCGTPQEKRPDAYNLCCLCGDCFSPLRSNYNVGPWGQTCLEYDFRMITENELGDPMCNAIQAAFQPTCCEASFAPPPPVPDQTIQVPPCERENPPVYCNGPYTHCDICKDASYPKKPFTIATIASVPGNPSCHDLYWMGREKAIPAAICYPIQNFLEEPCGCN